MKKGSHGRMDNASSNSHQTLFGHMGDSLLGHEPIEDMPTIAEANAPIIGIPIPVQQGSQGPQLVADAVGIWAVERQHGRVFLLPLWPFPPHSRCYHALWPLLTLMDGLLLPARLVASSVEEHSNSRHDQPDLQHWSTAWEMALAQLATIMDMPILAIGDGAYRWHLALGGAFQRDESPSSSFASPASWERHPLRVQATSSLAHWLEQVPTPEEPGLAPWALPLQASPTIEQLAPGVRSCAHADDGRLVAFERAEPSFGFGILARLDWGLDHGYSVAIFEQFFQAARSFAQVRAEQQPRWHASRERICASLSQQTAQGHPPLLTATFQAPDTRSQEPGAQRISAPPQARPERVRSSLPTRQALNAMRRQRWNIAQRHATRQ